MSFLYHNDVSSPVSEWLRIRDTRSIQELIAWCRPLLKELAEIEFDRKLRPRIANSDIVQDTCIELLHSVSQTKAVDRKQFWSYVKASFVNNLRDARRRFISAKKRSILREESIELTHAATVQHWLEHIESRPLEKLVHDENWQCLIKAILKLPRELQRVLWWRFRKGMTYPEIAQKVNRSEDQVRMLVQRCLKKIRGHLNSNDSLQSR